jgi:putative membrane protein
MIVSILIGFIAFLHLYFLWFEMFSWDNIGKKLFRTFPSDFFKSTKKWLQTKA